LNFFLFFVVVVVVVFLFLEKQRAKQNAETQKDTTLKLAPTPNDRARVQHEWAEMLFDLLYQFQWF
jgi:hypothetical protein